MHNVIAIATTALVSLNTPSTHTTRTDVSAVHAAIIIDAGAIKCKTYLKSNILYAIMAQIKGELYYDISSNK